MRRHSQSLTEPKHSSKALREEMIVRCGQRDTVRRKEIKKSGRGRIAEDKERNEKGSHARRDGENDDKRRG